MNVIIRIIICRFLFVSDLYESLKNEWSIKRVDLIRIVIFIFDLNFLKGMVNIHFHIKL